MIAPYADEKNEEEFIYFKEENAPEGSTARCVDCPHKTTCPYSAESIYINLWNERGCPTDLWPFNVLVAPPVTKEKILQAIADGPYGRCVYRCDNNVVDHQITQMTFENGVKVTLTMTGFTAPGGRRYHFHGTLGELILDEQQNSITLWQYGKDCEVISLSDLQDSGYAHGGGDLFIIKTLHDVLSGKGTAATSFEASIESHLMGICAEESRLKGGERIYIHK